MEGENVEEKLNPVVKYDENKPLSKISIFSQVLASSAQNLLLLDLGIAISFSTMIITALLNSPEGLSFTEEQASWFGSIHMIFQPIGSILSGFVLESLGRKKAIFVVNIPHIVAWLMIYFAQSVTTLFCANILLGLGTGFMEAPVITYVAEISHHSIRGTLITYSEIFSFAGIFLAYLMGTIMHWRSAAASFVFIPLLTFVTVYFIPESPIWLLSKKRKEDAMKALCWSRGWAKPEEVQQEFDDLVMYQKNSKKCASCTKSISIDGKEPVVCPHKNVSFWKRLVRNYKIMTRKQMRRPFILMILMFLFYNLTCVNAIRPNMVNIYKIFGMDMDGYLATNITGAIGLLTVLIVLLVVKRVGKRFLLLGSLFFTTITLFFLGLYAYLRIPHDASSYKPIRISDDQHSSIPTFLFIALNVFTGLGSNTIPWIMISEVFPLKGRGLAVGVTAAAVYIMNSVISKTFYNLEMGLGLYGTMWFYCISSFLGFSIMYFIMPETEGIPFTDIEANFSKKRIMIFANDPLTNFIRKQFKKSTVSMLPADQEIKEFGANK